MNAVVKLTAVLVLIIALVAVGPLITIWSWNTLFGSLHEIPYTFDTWLATICLAAVFKTQVDRKKD
jgi:hypothetical protein